MNVLSGRSEFLFPTLLLSGITAFVAFIYWDSVAAMFELWQTSSHQHGMLVFPISAYLIWRLFPHTRGIPIRYEPFGLLLVAALVSIWVVSRLAGVQLIEQASILALIPALVLATAGRKLFSKLLFPLLFILTALPVGDALVPYLMRITADVSAALLRLTGIPLLRDGQQMTLPGGSFVVAEVCSGLRYLMSGLILALLFSYLTFSSMIKRVVFVTTAAVVLVLANGFRAYLIMAVASATEMRYLGGADHVYFGWALFGVVIMLMMWVGVRYADNVDEAPSESTSTAPIAGSLRGTPLIIVLALAMLVATLNPLQSNSISVGKFLLGLLVLVVAVILARRQRLSQTSTRNAGSSLAAGIDYRTVGFHVLVAMLLVMGPQSVVALQRSALMIANIPAIEEIRGCSIIGSWELTGFPRMKNADIEESATLSCNDVKASVYVAGYASALQGSELVSGSNRLIPKNWTRIGKSSSRQFMTSERNSRFAKELTVDIQGQRSLVWFWYEVDNRQSSSPYVVKALQVWAMLRQRPAGGHVVLISISADPDLQEARLRIEAVAVEMASGSLKTSSGDQT